MSWISVMDKLPQAPLNQILVCTNDGQLFITYVQYWNTIMETEKTKPKVVITHWTLLPDCPSSTERAHVEAVLKIIREDKS